MSSQIKHALGELADGVGDSLGKFVWRVMTARLVARRDRLIKTIKYSGTDMNRLELSQVNTRITQAALHDLLMGEYPREIADRYGITEDDLDRWSAQDDEDE